MATDAAAKLKDMINVLQKKAPSIRPNTIPKCCKKYMDLVSICSTREQREAVQSVLDRMKREAANKLDDPHLVVQTAIDIETGTLTLRSAKYVSEVEADLYHVERILNLHTRGETDELNLRIEHFLSVNGYATDDWMSAQEVYSLAYSIMVCLGAAPIKVVINSSKASVPLPSDVDAGVLIEGLFSSSKGGGGGGGNSSKKSASKKGGEQPSQQAEAEGGGGGGERGGGGGKKRKKSRQPSD